MTTPINPPVFQPQKKSRKPLIIALLIAMAVFAFVIAVVAVVGSALGPASNDNMGLDDGFGTRHGAVSTPSNVTIPTQDEWAPANGYTLTKKDIVLKVKITKKDCSGSEYGLGCSVQWKIDASLKDLSKFRAAGKEYDVTYQIRGLKEEQTSTLHMDPEGSFTQDTWTYGDVPSKHTKLTAVVVDVEKTGF